MAKRNLHDHVVGGGEAVGAGALLVNPVTDERLRFTRTAEESGGRLLQAEFVAPPGWRQPGRLQSHPEQEERIRVLSGALRVRSSGAGHILEAGEWLTIPPGTAHAVTNEGSEEVRAILEWRPALGTQAFFETFVGLAREGRLRPTPRNVLQLAVWLYGFRREVRPAGAAALPLRLVLPPLAWLGGWLGLRRHYPRYSSSGGPTVPSEV